MTHFNFQEGQSTSRAPLLLGSENFNFWKFRMKIFLKRDPWEWWVVENGPTIPRHDDGRPKALMEMDTNESYMFSYNSRAMNTLLSGMVQAEIDKVSACNTAKEIWDTMIMSHEGTTKVKEVKLSMLMQEYELFKLERDETIQEAQARFLTLMNSLSMLGRKIDQKEINRKLLRVMPKRFAPKVTTLQDSTTISTMETLTLFGELEEFENQLRRYDEEEEAPIKKTLALQVESNNESDHEDFDEEIEMLSRKLERLLQRKKQRKNKKGSSTPKSKSKTEQEEEMGQLCFMGLEDNDQLEVTNFHEAFEISTSDYIALQNENQKLKKKTTYLKNCVNELMNEVESFIEERKENEHLKNENEVLKENLKMRDVCIDAFNDGKIINMRHDDNVKNEEIISLKKDLENLFKEKKI